MLEILIANFNQKLANTAFKSLETVKTITGHVAFTQVSGEALSGGAAVKIIRTSRDVNSINIKQKTNLKQRLWRMMVTK